jgi:PHD/YefM family antitoxin component YafN of YafNO toxin-antitoxin module
MQVFTSEELQLCPADVQQSALVGPTFITFPGRPRLVMMSLDEFDRLRGRRRTVLNTAELSEDVLAEIRRIAKEHSVEVSSPQSDIATAPPLPRVRARL